MGHFPSSTFETHAPSDAEKAVIAEYVGNLVKRGFCKLDDAASNQTRLYNRFNGKILYFGFLENDYANWLHRTGKTCSYRNPSYLAYTLPHVIGTKFVPNVGEYVTEHDSGCAFVNTYRKYEPSTEAADVSPLFIEYLERLFPVAEERHIVVQWLAHIFQYPEQRPSWHLMLTSEPGTGKGFLVQETLHPLLRHTSVVASYAKVMGQFSTVLEDNLLILLDDCKAKSETVQTQLKSLLSEERTYAERKHMQGGMVDTYARFILASNEYKPLHLDASERRWYVPSRLQHRESRQETQAFIKQLADWLAIPGSLCKVYNYFEL